MSKKVTLVLSGGGARGIAHIGVIEELEREGFEIISIAGTSMGALVGGVYALGKMDKLKKWLVALDKLKIFNLVDFTLSSQGFVNGDKLLNKMRNFIPEANIEDLEIAYTTIATDLINNEVVAFNSGSVYDAIRASIALPTVITPVKTANGLLVDGGVLNNIPVDQAKRRPNDILIVVNVNANIPEFKPTMTENGNDAASSGHRKKLNDFYDHSHRLNHLSNHENIGYFNLINKTIGLMTNQMALMALEKHTPDILVNVSRDVCGIFEFFKAEEMVDVGRQAAQMSIKAYLNKTKAFS